MNKVEDILNLNKTNSNKSINNSLMNKKECRYCLSNEEATHLINPCLCEGTMQYVHEECLDIWINNGNREIKTIRNDITNERIYSIKCEICKSDIKYFKTFRYSLLSSFIKMIKSLFINTRNFLGLLFNSVIGYFLIKRLSIIIRKFLKLKKFSFNLTSTLSFVHNCMVFSSIILGLVDIINYYCNIIYENRQCHRKFLLKSIS